MSGRVLALDVGSRRLGVAVSDPTGTVASPLATVPRRTPAEDAKALAALAGEHAATTVVVGLPVMLLLLVAAAGVVSQALRLTADRQRKITPGQPVTITVSSGESSAQI